MYKVLQTPVSRLEPTTRESFVCGEDAKVREKIIRPAKFTRLEGVRVVIWEEGKLEVGRIHGEEVPHGIAVHVRRGCGSCVRVRRFPSVCSVSGHSIDSAVTLEQTNTVAHHKIDKSCKPLLRINVEICR